jgi:diketogulonate reductase-like aldo/keto reductase
MPAIGLGTWKSDPGLVGAAVKEAVHSGYRLIDCAAAYYNEEEVGEAIQELISEGVVTRDELFIVGKCFQNMHVDVETREDRPREAVEQTLKDLQIDSLDLYLIHWPFAFKEKDLSVLEGTFRDEKGTPNPGLTITEEYLDTWRSLERLQAEGKVKDIGVSNFTELQIRDIIKECTVVPAVNQVEFHPYLRQPNLQSFCDAHNITMMGYSPLGSGDSYSGKSFPTEHGSTLLQNETVKSIGEKHGKTNAQVLIRWTMQHGFVCIPKSATPSRIVQNFEAQDFELGEADMQALDALDCNFRYGIGYGPGHYDCENAPWGQSQ